MQFDIYYNLIFLPLRWKVPEMRSLADSMSVKYRLDQAREAPPCLQMLTTPRTAYSYAYGQCWCGWVTDKWSTVDSRHTVVDPNWLGHFLSQYVLSTSRLTNHITPVIPRIERYACCRDGFLTLAVSKWAIRTIECRAYQGFNH